MEIASNGSTHRPLGLWLPLFRLYCSKALLKLWIPIAAGEWPRLSRSWLAAAHLPTSKTQYVGSVRRDETQLCPVVSPDAAG
jgi:hypothetical protein